MKFESLVTAFKTLQWSVHCFLYFFLSFFCHFVWRLRIILYLCKQIKAFFKLSHVHAQHETHWGGDGNNAFIFYILL